MLISAYITTTNIFARKMYVRSSGYIPCELNARAYYKIMCDVCTVRSIYVIPGKVNRTSLDPSYIQELSNTTDLITTLEFPSEENDDNMYLLEYSVISKTFSLFVPFNYLNANLKYRHCKVTNFFSWLKLICLV